jgi:hypothetical protein
VYALFGYLGWILAGTVAGFVAANVTVPRTLVVTFGVYAFLIKPMSQLAADNVPLPDMPTSVAVSPVVTAAATAPVSVPVTAPVTPTAFLPVPAGYVQTESGLVPEPVVPTQGSALDA